MRGERRAEQRKKQRVQNFARSLDGSRGVRIIREAVPKTGMILTPERMAENLRSFNQPWEDKAGAVVDAAYGLIVEVALLWRDHPHRSYYPVTLARLKELDEALTSMHGHYGDYRDARGALSEKPRPFLPGIS